MNAELLEKIKTECAGLYFFSEPHFNHDFGTTWDETIRLNYIAEPHDAFSRFRKLFLPKPLRSVATRISNEDDLGNFYIFQYPLNENRVNKQLNQMAETERFLLERVTNVDSSLRKNQTEPFNDKTFFAWFKERFSPSSVIYSGLWGYSMIVGRKSTNQEIMDTLKINPLSYFDLMRNLSPEITRTINSYQQKTHTVHIYDLIKEPKEVHFHLT
jgi:hypothetical protein